MSLAEHIKAVAGTPDWYDYDFRIAINYLRFVCSTEKEYEVLIDRIEELESINLPAQAIVQDIMARL